MANLGPCGLQTLARFSHCRLPFPGFEVVLPSDENSGLGVQLQKLRSPLVHQMIRHDERRFLRRVQPAKLHAAAVIVQVLPVPAQSEHPSRFTKPPVRSEHQIKCGLAGRSERS